MNKGHLKFDELETLCKPLLEYLYEHYNSHTEIVVSLEHIKIKQDVMGIPLQATD